ncbi:non-ribosomal peptide synthetase [Kutzneria kofuensis]|uniref:Amino acid adenylation domain-containing protein n=1 Tax=Kutzneria kofuensis TaxID=103725 RepID=A0A7W9KPJ4_9PSEU|nr:non-ribosomal peptide synthetase [Kutzneria kofuensis]MBB5896370.1 amino acid adenylation domain-containing protein [Kutzneria kofuensis]
MNVGLPPSPTARAGESVTTRENSLWLLNHLVPDSGVSNIALAFGVDSRLRWWPLQAAVSQLLRRHEVLRTTYHDRAGTLTRTVLPADEAVVDVDIVQVDSQRLDDELTAFAAVPFEPDGGLLVRAALFLCPAGDVFCLVAHHLVFDGRSVSIATRELVELVTAAAAEQPVPPALTGEVPAPVHREPARSTVEYWRQALDGVDGASTALSVGDEPSVQSDLRGGRILHHFGERAHAAVAELRAGLRASDHVILLAVFQALLVRHGAGPDVVVGCPVDIRGPADADTIGYLINTIAVRQQVTADTPFAELVRRTRATFLEAISHADASIDAVLAELPRQVAGWKSTVFRHMFNFMDVGDRTSGPLDRIGARGVDVHNGFSRFDFEFFVQRGAKGTTVRALYGADAFTAAEIELLLQRYEALLTAATAAPDSPIGLLDVFGELDRQLIDAANDTEAPVPVDTVPGMIARWVLERPDAAAVVEAGRTVSYRQLWSRVQDVATRLRACGVGPGSIVGVAGERSADLVAAVLGVLLCGAAYLPLDPEHPHRRFGQVIENSGVDVVIGDATALGAQGDALADLTTVPLTDDGSADPAPVAVEDASLMDGPAYVIYTSGTTGVPKGVRISHRSLANTVVHFGRLLGADGPLSTVWQTSFTFDISALELFLPLAHGAALVVADDVTRSDGAAFLDLVGRHDVRVVQATPTSWHQLLGDQDVQLAGRVLLCGGEPLTPALARRLTATGARVFNVYGPTETTIWSTCAELDRTGVDDVHVGRPIANTTVFIADESGRELPVGPVGELCIAGAGVAEGYHRADELTADRFGSHGTHGRFYRTGDLARWDVAGRIRLVGRADRQVKIRGNRIELDEIESVLQEHPEVTAAAVVLERAGEPDARLVAVVQAQDRPGLAADLWAHARAALAPAAVPQEFRVAARLPVTANGKLDRKAALVALPALTEAVQRPEPTDERLRNRLELLVRLWGRVLGRDDTTADTNFFLHGGHSLLGISLLRRLREATSVRVRLAELFANPTPRDMLTRLSGSDAGKQWPAEAPGATSPRGGTR